ncbi:MAG: Flp pilus assembly protein CpaB [Micromonosporaceae bacterium]|jgi:pilus assembly protein CpaB
MTRRILGVFLAVVLAAAGTAAVLAYVNAARNQVAEGQKAVKVLIAAERIPAGTSGASLQERGLVEEVVMPALSVPDGALSEVPPELQDLVVTSDLQPSQLLLRGMFGPPTRLSGGLQVPEGMLAVSVAIDVDKQVAGFVRPGSQVAIFNTYESAGDDEEEQPGQGPRTRTRLLLPRVEVLAVGVYNSGAVTTATGDGDGDGGGQAATAGGSSGSGLILTVSVDQRDAERLIHATRTGQLYLALLTDSSEVKPGPGVDIRNLFP